MTTVPELTVGPFTDALIADRYFSVEDADDWGPSGLPAFSTDMNATLLLIARLQAQGWQVRMTSDPDCWWVSVRTRAGLLRISTAAPTLPLAVCDAALSL